MLHYIDRQTLPQGKKTTKYSKIFKRNTIRFSYSCPPNGNQSMSKNKKIYINNRLLSLYRKKELQSTPLSRYSHKQIMISWNIPISSNFHVKLELMVVFRILTSPRCHKRLPIRRLGTHDCQVDLLILLHDGSVL